MYKKGNFKSIFFTFDEKWGPLVDVERNCFTFSGGHCLMFVNFVALMCGSKQSYIMKKCSICQGDKWNFVHKSFDDGCSFLFSLLSCLRWNNKHLQ